MPSSSSSNSSTTMLDQSLGNPKVEFLKLMDEFDKKFEDHKKRLEHDKEEAKQDPFFAKTFGKPFSKKYIRKNPDRFLAVYKYKNATNLLEDLNRLHVLYQAQSPVTRPFSTGTRIALAVGLLRLYWVGLEVPQQESKTQILQEVKNHNANKRELLICFFSEISYELTGFHNNLVNIHDKKIREDFADAVLAYTVGMIKEVWLNDNLEDKKLNEKINGLLVDLDRRVAASKINTDLGAAQAWAASKEKLYYMGLGIGILLTVATTILFFSLAAAATPVGVASAAAASAFTAIDVAEFISLACFFSTIAWGMFMGQNVRLARKTVDEIKQAGQDMHNTIQKIKAKHNELDVDFLQLSSPKPPRKPQ